MITPSLSSEALLDLTRRVRMQSGRPIERLHESRQLEGLGDGAETCGCGKQRLYHVVFSEEPGGPTKNLIMCADCDAMGRQPRWSDPTSVDAPVPTGP